MSDISTALTLEPDGTLVVKRSQDCEAIIERNKALQNAPQKSDWGRHLASIPCVILEQWLNEEWRRGSLVRWGSPEFDELVRRKLNDPDWKWLRTDK